MKHYLTDLPGKNGWGRYVSSTLIMFASIVIYGVFLGIFLIASSIVNENEWVMGQSTGMFVADPILDLLLLMSVYIFWGLALWFSIRVVHKRKLLTLITAESRLDWRQIFWGFGVYLGMMTIVQLLMFALFPHYYALNSIEWSQFFLLLVIVLLLVPIQTTVEELFFRGFLLQWIAKAVKRPFVLAIIMAIIFGAGHFTNPEMGRSALVVGFDYVFVGFMFTYIAVTMGRLELSIAAHAANNMFLFLFLSDDMSVGGSLPAPFRLLDIDPMISLIMDIVILVSFYLLAKRRFNPRPIEKV